MLLFKQYPTGFVEHIIKSHGALPMENAEAQENYLASFSATVEHLLKQY